MSAFQLTPVEWSNVFAGTACKCTGSTHNRWTMATICLLSEFKSVFKIDNFRLPNGQLARRFSNRNAKVKEMAPQRRTNERTNEEPQRAKWAKDFERQQRRNVMRKIHFTFGSGTHSNLNEKRTCNSVMKRMRSDRASVGTGLRYRVSLAP